MKLFGECSNISKIIDRYIGIDLLTKNGTASQMDTESVIISDRTYIPVRFIAEALGFTVEWI